MPYITAAKEASAEFTEKKSVFISYIKPIDTEADARGFISEVSEKNNNATHNVFAYVNRTGNAVRCSDAGEPSGTAGAPVLEVIKREGLFGAAIVVTRYFGGILLGAGGLVRAYSRAAGLAIEAAGKAVFEKYLTVDVPCDYSLSGKLKYEFEKRGYAVSDTVFGELVTFRVLCPERGFEAFSLFLADISGGRISPRVTGEKFAIA
ncbi:MAG: YigZ family protein [Oscillospiraceae bacterium]|nr:YigZ family protein [Oscillospiraceae bacterium]